MAEARAGIDINALKVGTRVLVMSQPWYGRMGVVTGFVYGTGTRLKRDTPEHRRLRTDERRLVIVEMSRGQTAKVRAKSLRLIGDPLRADGEGDSTSGDVRN